MRRCAALLGLLVLSTPAVAQSGGPEPDSTSARFGAWTLSCVGLPAARRCEMSFIETDRQQQAVAILALGRPGKGSPFKIVLRLPVNAQVSTPGKLTIDGGPAILLPFRMCAPAGCFAEFETPDETGLFKRLRAVSPDKAGRVEWQDANANQAGFEVPFKGLISALDGLLKEVK